MAYSVPVFYDDVVRYISLAVLLVSLVVGLVALVNCALQSSQAFAAIGTFPKGIWLIMLAGSALFVVLGLGTFLGGMLGMIAVAVALVYLLDVRPALRDAAGGRGSW